MTKQTVIIERDVVVVDAGIPGPPGPAGSPATGTPGNYFQTALRLAELDTPEKKRTARQNLGLQVIDGGEFFTATP